MAVVKENRCVGCHAELGCKEDACSYKNYIAYYCDKCKDEVDELYIYDNQQICESCLLEEVPQVGSDDW